MCVSSITPERGWLTKNWSERSILPRGRDGQNTSSCITKPLSAPLLRWCSQIYWANSVSSAIYLMPFIASRTGRYVICYIIQALYRSPGLLAYFTINEGLINVFMWLNNWLIGTHSKIWVKYMAIFIICWIYLCPKKKFCLDTVYII